MGCWLGLLGGLAAQVTHSTRQLPQAGDSLFYAVDNLPGQLRLGTEGANQRWDFTVLQSPFTQRVVWRSAADSRFRQAFPAADLAAPVDEYTEGYYRRVGTDLKIVGAYGADPFNLTRRARWRYQQPLTERWGIIRYRNAFHDDADVYITFAAADVSTPFLQQLPFRPDSLRIRMHIDREVAADAWGKLVIPGGIFDVLREKRTEQLTFRLDAKVGRRGWQDITKSAPRTLRLDPTRHVYYHFYSPEAKEPIASVFMDAKEEYPTRVVYKAVEVTGDVQSLGYFKPDVYAFPNPAIVNVRFEFYSLPPGTYRIIIFNLLGQEIWSQQYTIKGNKTEKADISSLRRGTYLYSLKDSRGNTLTTKRLVVIRP